jgi:hypothetical protein
MTSSTSLELFVRDNYALKEDVKESINELKTAVSDLAKDIKSDFGKRDEKIDKRAA